MSRAPEIAARIGSLPCWRGKVTIRPLAGGLSNLAFVVDDGTGRYVARCGNDIPVHHVYRDRELAASRAAHAAGLAPEPVYAEPGILVLRHVAGRTFAEADLRANLARILPLIRRCHRDVAPHLAGPASAFWVFHVIRDYARTLLALEGAPVASLRRHAALADALEKAQTPLPVVFGHHDLLPGNFIDAGSRLWLIDWEYAGFGTAMFDLANLSSNGSFTREDDERLLEGYFERSVPDELRRSFDAMKVAAALREAMWAMVSVRHLDAPDADYASHAADYLARTEAALARYEERHGSI